MNEYIQLAILTFGTSMLVASILWIPVAIISLVRKKKVEVHWWKNLTFSRRLSWFIGLYLKTLLILIILVFLLSVVLAATGMEGGNNSSSTAVKYALTALLVGFVFYCAYNLTGFVRRSIRNHSIKVSAKFAFEWIKINALGIICVFIVILAAIYLLGRLSVWFVFKYSLIQLDKVDANLNLALDEFVVYLAASIVIIFWMGRPFVKKSITKLK